MKKNISLFFVNDHFSISPPRPYVPAVVPIAGINIKQQPDPLPQVNDLYTNTKLIDFIEVFSV